MNKFRSHIEELHKIKRAHTIGSHKVQELEK